MTQPGLIRLHTLFPSFVRSVLNSYTQIFFSNHIGFAVLLMAVTFFDWVSGLSGLISVIVSNTLAYMIGFNRESIKSGFYGFNSLLVGLGLGVYFQLNAEFIFVLVFASLLTLFLTLLLEGVIGKYGLPFLSLSFLMGIWILTLATRQFTHLKISERGIFIINDLYAIGGKPLVDVYLWFGELHFHPAVVLYFRSLGAIFFQYHLFAGLLIAAGLLIYSRIAFLLSVLGFASAWFFYYFTGANISELSHSYIGFNFILTSIAVGGFFVISSRYSFMWVVLLTPLIAFLITSGSAVIGIYQLPVYSLPFNVVVLLFLYAMKFRERFYTKPEMVSIQYFSPEKNLYTQANAKARFRHAVYFPFSLPFWGEWKVTQGHDGDITHKKEWRHAWDFEISDESGSFFQNTGTRREDYYCYNKPVVAPANGVVQEILDGVEDNEIGEINTEQNWGNTLVIKHAEGLYSKLSHLKKESFRVAVGDTGKKNDLLAHCGNSGRSPQPHLHFQIQSTPFIGSKTLDYPLGNYIVRDDESFSLHSYERPALNERISSVEKNQTLYKALHLIPGQLIAFTVKGRGRDAETYRWEVLADFYNNTYLWCPATRSKLFFRCDDEMIYFTHYEGKKRTLLYYFYLGFYKVVYGFYRNLEVKDELPVNLLTRGPLLILQDFLAPFFLFIKSSFRIEYEKLNDNLTESEISLKSEVTVKAAGIRMRRLQFTISIASNRIEKFTVSDSRREITAGYCPPEEP